MLLMRSESIEAAVAVLAGQIRDALGTAIKARGTASLLVPGGRTPVPLFRALRSLEIPWSCVSVGLTDERWVEPGHPDSNARLVQTELLTGAAADAAFVPLRNSAPNAGQGAAQSWRDMTVVPQPFDVVVLGMGEDGHFASLFPGSPGLLAALDPDAVPGCVAMRAPAAPLDRISLNLAALGNSRRLFLFVTGRRKLDLLRNSSTREALPIDALLALPHPRTEVFWAP
jgi:6-phosphogluconolactonase